MTRYCLLGNPDTSPAAILRRQFSSGSSPSDNSPHENSPPDNSPPDNSPVIYALLPNKEEGTYERFFIAVKALDPTIQPLSVLTDFEHAAVNALNTVFQTPNNDLSLHGCFFHTLAIFC